MENQEATPKQIQVKKLTVRATTFDDGTYRLEEDTEDFNVSELLGIYTMLKNRLEKHLMSQGWV